MAISRALLEKRSINLLENKITGISTKVPIESAVPTAPVGTPKSFSNKGRKALLMLEQPITRKVMAMYKRNCGWRRKMEREGRGLPSFSSRTGWGTFPLPMQPKPKAVSRAEAATMENSAMGGKLCTAIPAA